MSCADKFSVSSSSLSSSSSSKFFANNFTKPLWGSFPPFNTRRVCPLLTCLHSKTPPLSTNFSSIGKKKMDKNNKDNIAMTSIVKSLGLANKIEDALDSFADSLSPKGITMILKELRNWERVVRAFNWFKSQESYIPNVIHYNVVLRALGRAQQWDQLRLCWIEMAKIDVLPTNNTYCMLVDVYGKAGLAKESLLWIKHMRMRGFFPDEVTMSTVVRVLKELGEFDRADRFYKNWASGRVDLDDLDLDSLTLDSSSFKQFLSTELFKTGGGILDSNDMSSLNVPPKPRLTTTYNALIDMYGKAGRLKDAAGAFADMMKSGVEADACTFNTMIYICGSHGNLLEAEALLVKMEEKRMSPNTRTFNIFVSLYANAGNIDSALGCYRRIREAGLSPDDVTYSSLLGALCANNMVQAVETVIDEMDKSSVSVDDSLPGIVKMYINQGDVDKANDLLQKFLMNREPSSTTCAAIIDAFAEKGLWSEAENIFYRQKDMSGRKRDVVEYNVMIKAFGKANLYDKALSLFKEMRSQGVWANDSTYNSIIQMLSGADLGHQATDLIFEMQEMGFKPHCQTFSAVIGCYARLGQLSDAVAMYQEMLNAGVKPNVVVFGSIINGFAEHGNLDEALKYFHLMEESGIEANLVVLSTLLKSYCKVGNLKGVKDIYEKMKNIEGGLDLVACNSMISTFADLGLVSEAKLAFENLKEMGRANSVSYGIMMYVYKDVGLMDEASKLAEEMKLSGLLTDCVSYNKVLMCYADNNQFQECRELLHEMVSKKKISPNNGIFKVLLHILKKGKFPIEAVDQLEFSFKEGKPYATQATLTAVYSLLGMRTLALESAKAFLESKVEIDLDSPAYNAAIYAYASAGYVDKALNIYMKMRDKRVEPDIVTYIYLVGCYGKAGMLEAVNQIFNRYQYGDIEQSVSLFKAIEAAYKLCNRRLRPDMKPIFKSSEDSEIEIESEGEGESESEGEYEIGSDAEYDYNSDIDF